MKLKAATMVTLILVLGILLCGCGYSAVNSKIWKDAKQSFPAKWDLKLDGKIVEHLVSEGKAYLITDNQKLTVADAATGKVIECINLNFSTTREICMLSQDQDLLAMNFTDSIKVVNLNDKKTVMDKKLSDLPTMYTSDSLLVYKDTVLYEESGSHDVVAMEVQTGKLLWRMSSNGAHSVDMFSYGGQCFLTLEDDLYHVDATTGVVLSKYRIEKIEKFQGSHRYVSDIVPAPLDSKIYEYLKWKFCPLENSSEGFAYEADQRKLDYYGRGKTLLWELDLPGKVVDENVYNRLAIITEEDNQIDIIDLEKKKALFHGSLDLQENDYITVDNGFLYVPCKGNRFKAFYLKPLIKQ